MCNRSRIIDIVQFHNYLILRTNKGACLVYNTQSYKRHMFLNPSKFDVIETVFVNRLNDEVIFVAYRQQEDVNVLQCRSIGYAALVEKDIAKATLLFRDEVFMAPSYFEFDEYNRIIITYCAQKEYRCVPSLSH